MSSTDDMHALQSWFEYKYGTPIKPNIGECWMICISCKNTVSLAHRKCLDVQWGRCIWCINCMAWHMKILFQTRFPLMLARAGHSWWLTMAVRMGEYQRLHSNTSLVKTHILHVSSLCERTQIVHTFLDTSIRCIYIYIFHIFCWVICTVQNRHFAICQC